MGLIRTVLELIRQKLNKSFEPMEKDWVMLSNIVDQEGHPYAGAKDRIVMVLANIKHETVISAANPIVRTKTRSDAFIVPPPLYIDLYILFYANFYDDNYQQGLAMISHIISFFQQNPWFTADNLPGLPPVIDKLTMEITNLDLLEVNYLMGMLGAKYLPSVLYKLRLLPFVGDAIRGVTSTLSRDDTKEEPKSAR